MTPEPSTARIQDLEAQLTRLQIDLVSSDHELKRTQQQLIVSEKMAAIGQLVANVAHEINTPTGVMRSSANTIERLLPTFVEELPSLLVSLTTEQMALFRSLLLKASTNDTSLTTKEERNYRKQLEDQFTASGMNSAPELASALVEMQMVEGLEEYDSLLRLPQSMRLIEVLKYLAQIKGSVVNLNLAAEKIVKIITALKSYSYSSKDENFESVNLDTSIQSVLTIYHNLLKHGVQLIKEYDDTISVPAIPDQIAQVWANLLANSIAAMNRKGTLRIGIKKLDPYAVITVTDSGHGIPDEIVNRIFEPFFTTKEPGEGNGLGLDIVRRIVERHRGKVSVTSRPGETVFTVQLPLSTGV
jgi:signal transduction histidine kinase